MHKALVFLKEKKMLLPKTNRLHTRTHKCINFNYRKKEKRRDRERRELVVVLKRNKTKGS